MKIIETKKYGQTNYNVSKENCVSCGKQIPRLNYNETFPDEDLNYCDYCETGPFCKECWGSDRCKNCEEQKQNMFSGNCGMYAVALGKKAQEQGKNVAIVVISNVENEDELLEEPDIYHVAVEIDGKLYDGSGEASLQEISNFYGGKIYGRNSVNVSYLALDKNTINMLRQNTNWNTFWTEIYKNL